MSATATTNHDAFLTREKIDALINDIDARICLKEVRLHGLNIAIATLQRHRAECDDEVEEAEQLAIEIHDLEVSREQMKNLARLAAGKIDTTQN